MARKAGTHNKPRPPVLKGRAARQRLIARVWPVAAWEGYAYDPKSRDSKGHLKPSVVAALDKAARDAEMPSKRAPKLSTVEDESDMQYVARKNAENEKLDEEWWAIPKQKRPPFLEFLKQRGIRL